MVGFWEKCWVALWRNKGRCEHLAYEVRESSPHFMAPGSRAKEVVLVPRQAAEGLAQDDR